MLFLILSLYEMCPPTSIFAVNLDHQRSTHPFNWKMTGTFYFEEKKKFLLPKTGFLELVLVLSTDCHVQPSNFLSFLLGDHLKRERKKLSSEKKNFSCSHTLLCKIVDQFKSASKENL